MDKGAVVWNPWLKLSRCISQPNFKFQVIGCDSNRRSEESIYKTIWCNTGRVDRPPYLKIHDLASCTWKDASVEFSGGSSQEKKRKLITRSGVSLNGTLFWISFSDKTDPLYQLVTFDFSSEVFYIFCDLPCGKSHPCDALVLWVFKRDRFSVLKQCHITKKIEIWVTKNKVNVKDGNDVLPWDTLGLEYQKPRTLGDCDEFLICNMDKGAVVWNPWLKQSAWIGHPSSRLEGICYNGSNRRSEVGPYKTIWYSNKEWKVHDFAFGTWKNLKVISKSNDSNQSEKQRQTIHSEIGVFLNGSLFWICFLDSLYSLSNFNFSKGRFSRFCDLPCGMSHLRDALVLRIFKGDRFSLLKQCNVTKKTELWVTKNKVNVEDGRDVVWVNFMTLSIPSFPSLVPTKVYSQQPSYFIDDKRLVVCSCDETGQAWIYVFGGNKLIDKVRIDSVVDPWPLHCTYFPSLVPVPRVK
ncbi:hypothetical protein Bca52824_028888 [Brassica carinata]|uniref:F-box associated beta-propeller type 1 domain-containing protein n=1 Tax=Brassica carinata TaxID=52824 RepID=A0A8X7VD03_BRACI|nr:hypothetical protein Bca52824_028888 [Brassica carinata]